MWLSFGKKPSQNEHQSFSPPEDRILQINTASADPRWPHPPYGEKNQRSMSPSVAYHRQGFDPEGGHQYQHQHQYPQQQQLYQAYNFREGVPTGAMTTTSNNSSNGKSDSNNNRIKTSRREQSRKDRGGARRTGGPGNGFRMSAERSTEQKVKENPSSPAWAQSRRRPSRVGMTFVLVSLNIFLLLVLLTSSNISIANTLTELLKQDARGEEGGQLRVHVPELHLPIICIPLENENGQLIPMLELLHEKNQFAIDSKHRKAGDRYCGGYNIDKDPTYYYIYTISSQGSEDSSETLMNALERMIGSGKATVTESRPKLLDCELPKIKAQTWSGSEFEPSGSLYQFSAQMIKTVSMEHKTIEFNPSDLLSEVGHGAEFTVLLRSQYHPCNVHSCFCLTKITPEPGKFRKV